MSYPHLAQSNGYTGPLGAPSWTATAYYIQIYLDDILLLTPSKDTLPGVVHTLQTLLKDLGVLCHPHQCELTPIQTIDFLGMRLDIPGGRFLLTDKQRSKLQTKSDALLAEANR